MRPILTIALASLAALGPAGCTMSHVQFVAPAVPIAKQGDGVVEVGHLYANSWGVYLPLGIPIIAGTYRPDGSSRWGVFEDGVRVETVVAMLRIRARQLGATHLLDVQSHWISEWLGGFLFAFWLVESEGSATAIRVPAGATPPDDAVPLGP